MQVRTADRGFPQAPMLGVAAVIALVLVLAWIGGAPPPPETAAALRTQDLLFEDREDGAVTVRAPGRAAPVAVLDPGTNGFTRAALRGLARERWRSSHGPETPFRLVAWDDGRLTLDDLATGRRIDLKAFGPTQAEAFTRLFVIEEGRR
ncbi:MAG: hypothetical protein K2X49_00360 [Acetobacteraceae bacterium]|nr:hypothetical protein [Acetobacteraceae bacterium]